MKPGYIFLILLVGVAVAVIVSTTGSVSQYVDYEVAVAMASEGNRNKVHLIGQLKRDTYGNPEGLEYNPTLDPNHLAFKLIDEKGKELRVVANPPASMQDFLRSEKIVLEGRVREDGTFVASEILLKCPSKYEEKEIKE